MTIYTCEVCVSDGRACEVCALNDRDIPTQCPYGKSPQWGGYDELQKAQRLQ